MFEEFWQAYPRKIGKGAARKAWEKAVEKSPPYEIMAGVEKFKRAKPWRGDLQFCPHPTTWLNQERWEDEYEAERDHTGQRKMRLEALVVRGLWLDAWGEQPTVEQARTELGRPSHLKVVK